MLPILSALLFAEPQVTDAASHFAAGQAAEAADLPAAKAHYAAACALTHPAACRRLVLVALLLGEDPQVAIDAMAAACDQGDLQACLSLATVGAVAFDLTAMLAESCRSGDAQSCAWKAQQKAPTDRARPR